MIEGKGLFCFVVLLSWCHGVMVSSGKWEVLLSKSKSKTYILEAGRQGDYGLWVMGYGLSV
jgi:hypothetical protein